MAVLRRQLQIVIIIITTTTCTHTQSWICEICSYAGQDFQFEQVLGFHLKFIYITLCSAMKFSTIYGLFTLIESKAEQTANIHGISHKY